MRTPRLLERTDGCTPSRESSGRCPVRTTGRRSSRPDCPGSRRRAPDVPKSRLRARSHRTRLQVPGIVASQDALASTRTAAASSFPETRGPYRATPGDPLPPSRPSRATRRSIPVERVAAASRPTPCDPRVNFAKADQPSRPETDLARTGARPPREVTTCLIDRFRVGPSPPPRTSRVPIHRASRRRPAPAASG